MNSWKAQIGRRWATRLGMLVLLATLAFAGAQVSSAPDLAAAKSRVASKGKACKKVHGKRARQRCWKRARSRSRIAARPGRGKVQSVSNAVSLDRRGCASASHTVGYGTFGRGNRPSACWRPYADDSPFNTRVTSGTPTVSGSAAKVSRLTSSGEISYFVAGDSARDWGTAVYFSSASDPVYTIQCTEPWGECDLEGDEVHLPAGAAPSGTWPIGDGDADSHLSVVDQESGWEYDLWNVRSIGSGKIVVRWGGKTRIDGDGLDSDAVAARFGSLAGIIRASELKAGFIEHALALTVPCTVGYVAPATKGGMECQEAGMSSANALPMGAHLQLQMTSAEIQALDLPRWKEAIIQAFATYGAYVEDTTGEGTQWGLKWESAASETSLGESDGFVALAKSLNMQPEDYNGNGQPEYWFDVAGGVDWSRLRVVG